MEETSMKPSSLQPNTASQPHELHGPLHIGLAAEDLEDSSIAEQLEALLERLRLDSKGRISSDSGAVSDLDSCSVTTLGEECHMRQDNSERCSPLFDKVSSEVRASTETRSGRNKITDSTAYDGPAPHAGGRSKPTAGKNSDTTYSKTRHRTPHTKRGRKSTPQGDLEGSSSHQNVVEKNAPLKEAVRSKVVQHTPQTEVAQNHSHKQDMKELEASEKTPFSADQQVAADTQQEPNTEGSSSPTEGGPFITHWGKGRLRRSVNTRDYHSNRRPYSSQYNRQRFGGQRYSARGHLGNTTYYGRDAGTQSSHRNDFPQRQKGWETAAHYRTGKPREKFERDKSPQQRREQQPAVSAAKNISTDSIAIAPPIQSNASAPSQVPSDNPSQQKLSYASVTGSVGKTTAAAVGTITKQPPPPCNGIKEQIYTHDNGETDSTTNDQKSTSSCGTKEQVSSVVTEGRSNGMNEQHTTTPDNVQCCYQDIATSFNYHEVVEFLRKGEFIFPVFY